VLGVPQSNYSADPRGAWIQGTGNIRCQRVRFGGEAGLCIIRCRTDMKYNGRTLAQDYVDASTLPCITIRDSPMASTGQGGPGGVNPLEGAGIAWLEIYDRFPALIDVQTPSPSPLGTGRSYVELVGTNGIWVDSVSCPKSSYLSSPKNSLLLKYDAWPPGGFRIVTGSDPLHPRRGVDLTTQMRQYTTDLRFEPLASDAPRQNLWLSGGKGAVSPRFLVGGVAGGVTWSGSDTTSGYTLDTLAATGASAYGDWAYYTFESVDNANPNGWGGGLAEGLYTFSFYYKSNFGAQALFYLAGNQGPVTSMPIVKGQGWHRAWCSFYHDGTQRQLAVGIYNIPHNGVITLGLLAIHKGPTPAAWTYPGNPTVEDVVREQYWGPSMPASGTFKQGDITWNTNPQSAGPNAYVGWICITGGTPGIWRPFGAIA
jgi:hypothetical protein